MNNYEKCSVAKLNTDKLAKERMWDSKTKKALEYFRQPPAYTHIFKNSDDSENCKDKTDNN